MTVYASVVAAYRGTSGPAELQEEARGHGGAQDHGGTRDLPVLHRRVGCDRADRRAIYLPRATRLAMATLTAPSGADVLQFAHTWLERTAE